MSGTHNIPADALCMFIDSSRCIDCKGCMVSCKVANNVPHGQWRNWIKDSRSGCSVDTPGKCTAHYQPGGCMQCGTAPCLDGCPTGATFREQATGVVLVDRDLCIGCNNCITACPYGARFRHAALNVADKCDFCASRRAQGLVPACVDTCPTKARMFGTKEEVAKAMQERMQQEGAPPVSTLVAVQPAGQPTDPRLVYANATAPAQWPAATEQAAPMQLMTGFAGKALYAAIAGSAFGVVVMGLTQLRERKQNKQEPEHRKEEGNEE